MLGQEPPIHRRSTTAVRRPDFARSQASSLPPNPLPRIRTSTRSDSDMSFLRLQWLDAPQRLLLGRDYHDPVVRADARRFLDEMRERFAAFSLSLHPVKTRVIEFGRRA